MQINSLGLQTDLLFRRFEGAIVEREGYMAIRTPKNPGYRWGNFLLFQGPPKAGDFERWKDTFAKEIGTPPAFNHFVFVWDGVDGDLGEIDPFLEAGFRVEKMVVMTAQRVQPPPKVNRTCTIRPFVAEDWQAWVEMELAANLALPEDEREDDADRGFREYVQNKADEYQRMIGAGLGQWFGAFVDGVLAASLGLFVWDGLGRFQAVSTHPNYRRQGLAGTLVYEIAQKGFSEMGAETLVMCADPDYIAIDIYESVGFQRSEQMVGIEWHK